jgi:multidrug efflux pump subunit AcrA (membrane-fusion protein)
MITPSKPFHVANIKWAIFFFLIWGCGKKEQSIKANYGTITEAVYAYGKVKAEGQYQVFPTVTGVLSKIEIFPSDTVKKGDRLFLIENLSSALSSENARLALDLTETNSKSGSDRLQELEQAVEIAREKYMLDSNLWVRQKNLLAQNVGSQVDYEQRKLSFETAKSNFRSAESRLGQVRIQLKNELQRARIGYKLSKKQQRDFEIRSQLAGVVFDVLRTEGDVVGPQTALAVIGKPDAWYLELQVSERDIGRIEPGQRADIVLDGYKGQVFEARLERIYPILNERTRNFRIDAKFEAKPPKLFPNMNVEANIRIRTKSGVLTIPRRYLLPGNQVRVGKDKQIPVAVGLKDFEKVEILSGIDTLQEIFLPR